jgi:hypothetical protein
VVTSNVDRLRFESFSACLALELAAGARTGLIEPAGHDAIKRIAESASRSSKLGKAAGGLVDLRRDDQSYAAILRLAASAVSG